MANAILNPSIIAKEALLLLNNSLVMGNLVHRAHEKEFTKSINGYETGATVNIRRPNQFTVRTGSVASAQDVQESTVPLTVNQQAGVDFKFTSTDLTLNIKDLSERVIKPAMVALANKVDQDLFTMYKSVYNWVGTPGTNVSSFTAFGRAGQRLDEMAVPADGRSGVLSPADHWATLGTLTGLYMEKDARSAFREAKLGTIGSIETYKGQNVPTHIVGTKAGAPVVNGAGQSTTYAASGAANAQNLVTNGWTASSAVLKQGDVFTIAGVFAVNPVTGATLPYLQQFVANADVTADGAGAATFSISPAIITTGAFKTVSAAPGAGAAIVVSGNAGTGYSQNLVFNRGAFALAVVPMVKPPGAVSCTRQSMNGLSVRMIPYYDGTNDVANYRLDILYGFKAIDPRLAARLAG